MKTKLINSLLLVFLSIALYGQNSVPAGLRYQAIARSADGLIRAQEELSVRAELVVLENGESVVFSERHTIQSGEFGLLNLTIGDGLDQTSSLYDIDWSQPIWVRIFIKGARDADYELITTSKLYAVPYAFYAEKAGRLAGGEEGAADANGRGVKAPTDQTAIYWALDGNTNAHKIKGNGPPVLGTTDRIDLTFITNNINRMVISKDGPLSILSPTQINGNFLVNGNSMLNGSLDVLNGNYTRLTGTLQVQKHTTLLDGLNVDNFSPTKLSGLLYVGGNTTFHGSTIFENNLTVSNGAPTVLTGTLQVDKQTTLNSSLTVENGALTELTGSLDVDQNLNVDGNTVLDGSLEVLNMSATHLTGTLRVDKATTLNSMLTVENQALTHLTGDLQVDGGMQLGGDVVIDGSLRVAGMHPTNLTGKLNVDGLATLNNGLIVNGEGKVGPNGEHLAFFNNTDGGQTDGIAIKINNANTTAQNNFVTFYKGDNSVAGRIEGYVTSDIGSPPVPTSDEIWSAVCITIADYNPITIYWTQFAKYFNLFGTVWNGTTIPSVPIPDFPGLTLPDFPGQSLPDFPGLVLPNFPGQSLPDFPGLVLPDIGSVSIDGVGTIFPGLTIPDIPGLNIPDIPSFNIPDVPPFVIPDIPAFTIPDIPAFTIPDIPEIDLSEDLFSMPTIPTFSDILIDLDVCPDVDIFDPQTGYVRRLLDWGVQNDMQNMISFNPVDLVTKAITWGITKVVKSGGVTYGSQGADYAEYLPKLNEYEQFMGGEVVGVHGGRISKVTEGADQILAISTRPLVLGNQPDEEDRMMFEKVGFLGQVPTFVEGPVTVGDYIIPSGKNDGKGKAVSKDELKAEMLPMVLGRAWSGSDLNTTTVINVSIGLRPTEIAELLQQREQTLRSMKEQIQIQDTTYEELKSDLEKIKMQLMQHANANSRS